MPYQKEWIMEKLICSIGVLAYNESANIAKLLDSLLTQKLDKVEIKEIIVVSSASTDGTDEIVNDYARKYAKISLIAETERKGKSSAINNFIAAAQSNLLIIESADTIPADDTVEKFIRPFRNLEIGMTGGRPVPENSENDLVGYSVNLLWRLHHKMALRSPKLGEMVAFRKCFKAIPAKSAVDEASIEAIIRAKNMKLKYIPDAIVHNKGPENLNDFIMQRKRIASGHIWLKETENYEVSSQNKGLLMELAFSEIKENPKKIHFLIATILLEIYSRFLGWYDLKIMKKNPFKWDIAKSTKNLNHKEM